MALIDAALDNSVGDSWCNSSASFGDGDLGTPRATNDCRSQVSSDVGALVINEIMQNPRAVSDSDGEWFELFNGTGSNIDINGWTIEDGDTDRHVIDNGGPLVVPSRGFLVLGKEKDPGLNGGINVDYSYGSDWELSDSADEVVLLDDNLAEIDRVEYDGGLAFTNPRGPKGLLGEPSDWLYDFLIHPIVLAYFCWMQTAGKQLFSELARSRAVSRRRQKEAARELRDQLNSPWTWRIGVICSLLFVAWFTTAFTPDLPYSLLDKPPYRSWITIDPTIAYVRAPVIFVVFYALVIIIYDLYFIIRALNIALKDETFHIEPFHPDRAGGIGFIGRFSANLGYLIGALGILLFSRMFGSFTELVPSDPRNYVFLLGIVAYLVAAPLVFFMPLRTAHLSMIGYRNVLLGGISDRFSALMAEIRAASWKDEKRTEGRLKQIEQLDKVRESITKQVPIWPFNTDSLRKFFGISLAPLVAAIISAIIDLAINVANAS